MFAPIVKAGIGLHTGANCSVLIEAMQNGYGITLVAEGCEIAATPESVIRPARLRTIVAQNKACVETVEHLFAALNAYGETDVRISVNGPEIPILDGSSLVWAEILKKNGALENPFFVPVLKEVEVRLNDSYARLTPISPQDEPCFHVLVEFPKPVGCQEFIYRPQKDSFIKEVAHARTFAFESDIRAIHSLGLGRGGSLKNTLVIGDKGPINPEGMRSKDEMVRHKLLDSLGDLFILGGIPWAKMEMIKPGHELMHALIERAAPFVEKQHKFKSGASA